MMATGDEIEVHTCYIEAFPHALPHRDEAQLRPCGHWACDPHTITYYGTGEEQDEREGDYCMVCYERTFPGMCPDRVLRAAIRAREAEQGGTYHSHDQSLPGTYSPNPSLPAGDEEDPPQ